MAFGKPKALPARVLRRRRRIEPQTGGARAFVTAFSRGTERWPLAPAEVFWRKEGPWQRAWGDRSGTARTISRPSLLKSLKTVSVAVERNLSPGLLLLHDAEYLSPLCFLSFSLTRVHTFAETTNYVNQREVISGREMFAGCVVREVLHPAVFGMLERGWCARAAARTRNSAPGCSSNQLG